MDLKILSVMEINKGNIKEITLLEFQNQGKNLI